MAFTDPKNVVAWITAHILGHDGLLSRVMLKQGRAAGKAIEINVTQPSSTDTIDGALLTGDQDNVVLTITGTPEARRVPLDPGEYNDWNRDPSYREAQIAQMADDLRISMENALDTAMVAATNTVALATDNTFTLALFWQAVATALSVGARLEDLSFITGPAGWASIMTAGFANAGGSVAGISGAVGNISGIPCFVSQNVTIATTTGDPAGYLWARQGIQAGIAGIDFIGPQKSALTGTADVTATLMHGFVLNASVATKFVTKFTNP